MIFYNSFLFHLMVPQKTEFDFKLSRIKNHHHKLEIRVRCDRTCRNMWYDMYLYVLVCSVHEKFFISKEKLKSETYQKNWFDQNHVISKKSQKGFSQKLKIKSCDISCDISCDRSKKSRGVWETSRDRYKNWRSVDQC